MNYKFLKPGLYVCAVLSVFAACVKPHDATFTDLSTTSDIVILQNAGLTNFNPTAFNRGSDTITLTVRVDLASKEIPTNPTNVTLAVDDTKRTEYNTANPQPVYLALPAANYKLTNTTLTIPAGSHYAQTTLLVFTKGLDPTLSYMVPVTIKDASGKSLSSNANTIYFHTIGNPLAGTYTWTGYRWNEATGMDTTTAPASTPKNNVSIALGPINATTLYLPTVYLDQNGVAAGTALSFTNNAGVLSNFSVAYYDPTGALAANGWSVVTGPKLVGYKIVGDASTKFVGSTFRIYYTFFNGAAQRTTIDNFVKTQ